MAWVAVNRALSDAETFARPAPVRRWQALRDAIRGDVLAHGYDAKRNAFTQSYGSQALDATALLIPFVGFLPATDERMRGTVAAIERELCRDGLVYRYTNSDDIDAIDGLRGGEGAFLACSLWLAGNYARSGRLREARTLFERLLSLRNDVGLLAERYDPRSGRQLGNFPQAFNQVPLVMAAHVLDEALARTDTTNGAVDTAKARPRTGSFT